MQDFYICFKDIMTISTGIAATGFSLYFAWQKIGVSLKATYSIYSETLSAPRLNDIIISNNKNKPIEIYDIYAILDNKYYLMVEKFDMPIILKALETIQIKTSQLSNWYCKDEKVDVGRLLFRSKLILYVSTNTSIIKCKTLKHKNPLFSNKFNGLKFIDREIMKFNDMVYTTKALYAIVLYKKEEYRKTAFVMQGGHMTDSIGGHSFLSSELLINKDTLRNYLTKQGLQVIVLKKDELTHHFS